MNRRTPVVVLGSAILLTACSSTTEGTPSPVSSSSVSTKQVPYAGAPKVARPLADSVLSGSPCEALSPGQIKDDVGPGVAGKPSDTPLGQQCDWNDHQGGALLTITFTTKQKEGLSALYQQVKPTAPRFDVLAPIQDFPAVAYSLEGTGPRSNSCNVTIGLSDTLEFSVDLELGTANYGKTDACAIAATIADHATTTLKTKAGQ